MFVDIPVETSVSRAMSRYSRGLAEHKAGRGSGGRYVSPHVIRENEVPGYSSKNRLTFEGLKSPSQRRPAGAQAASDPGTEWAVIAPTFRDVRKVCVEDRVGRPGVPRRGQGRERV